METKKTEQQDQQVWICDVFNITHCEVNDDAVIYTVTYVDFMGLQRQLQAFRPLRPLL